MFSQPSLSQPSKFPPTSVLRNQLAPVDIPLHLIPLAAPPGIAHYYML